MAGVDRHGELSLREAEVVLSSGEGNTCFVGTRAAFGAFDQSTVVIDASGIRRSIGAIVTSGDISGMRCENSLAGETIVRIEDAVSALWETLGLIALVGDDQRLLFRRSKMDAIFPDTSVLHHRGSIAEVSHSGLQRFVSDQGFDGLARFLEAVLESDGTTATIPRSAYGLALWLATARRATGSNYRFTFDSLQHTASIAIEMTTSAGHAEALRTAFVSGKTTAVRLSWQDRSWSPISSGFILEGGGT